MTAMVQHFDGVRELSMEEVDAVSGAGIGEFLDNVANAVDVNNDGDVFDEVALGATAVAVGAGFAGAAPVAVTFGVIAAGAAYLNETA